jgi:hypothetical protein
MQALGVVMARTGRKRKSGARYPNGQLRREHQDSPRVVAAGMPHRRGLGEHGADQKAESELGRMALFGRISGHQYLAGVKFANLVGAYLATIQPPRALAGNGRGYDCDSCPPPPPGEEPGDCECFRRRTRYMDAHDALMKAGRDALIAVKMVAVHDERCPWKLMTQLNWGLAALVQHFGLTKSGKS